MSSLKIIAIALCLFCAMNARGQADDPRYKVSTGFDYSVGDYGDTEDTKIHYIPVSASYSFFPWTAKVTVPYLSIEGPGGVVGGVDGGVVVGEGDVEVEKNEGLGDVVASVMYSIEPAEAGRPFIDFTAKVKIPTADEDDGLGTGETDYKLQVDVAQQFGDFTPFVTAGYQFMGSSDEVELDDRALFSVGTDYRLQKGTSLGLAYDYIQAASDSSDDGSEALLYINQKLADAWTLNVYTVKGFSDGSPDWSLGSQVSHKF